MKKIGLFFSTTFLALFLIACGTSYQSKNMFGFGYSDFRTSPDSFTVTFKGKGDADAGMVLQYALRRAAEITIENGFTYFQVVSTKDHFQTVSSGNWNYGSGYASTSTLPSVNVMIKCFSEKPENIEVIEAQYFLSTNQKDSNDDA